MGFAVGGPMAIGKPGHINDKKKYDSFSHLKNHRVVLIPPPFKWPVAFWVRALPLHHPYSTPFLQPSDVQRRHLSFDTLYATEREREKKRGHPLSSRSINHITFRSCFYFIFLLFATTFGYPLAVACDLWLAGWHEFSSSIHLFIAFYLFSIPPRLDGGPRGESTRATVIG